MNNYILEEGIVARYKRKFIFIILISFFFLVMRLLKIK